LAGSFGDFLNDLMLLDAATYSLAMANAHPEVDRRAAWRAPANTVSGVTAAVAALIGMDVP
jgi:hydroxymethylpyrimidine pyrophosphatase-like HAD family hydrolase